MALSYSVRFAKQGLSGKVVMEKEGEIVFNRTHIRLKGKGANDSGEVINFAEIKELKVESTQFIFTTHSGEKFLLSRFGTAYQAFLEDFFKLKNEFFIEALLMKSGMLCNEFDCHVEVDTPSGKHISKGSSVMQIYEGGIVFWPKLSDAFVIYLSFLKSYEFDTDEYVLNLEAENGIKVNISKLGSSFVDAENTLETQMEKMFQKTLNNLNNAFPGFAVNSLLKLANLTRGGKAVSLKALKKIDASLPAKFNELLYQKNSSWEAKIAYLRGLDKDEELFLGICFEGEQMIPWFAVGLPSLNLIVLSAGQAKLSNQYLFLRITAENKNNHELLHHRLLEINQAMLILGLDFKQLAKNKDEIQKSRFKNLLQKYSYLKQLRKLKINCAEATDLDRFENSVQRCSALAQTNSYPVSRHRRPFKSTIKR